MAYGADSPKRQEFLAAVARVGNITHAADIAGISRDAHYDWLQNCPTHRAEFTAAMEAGADRLEQEARRRGVEGVEEPVYQGGVEVGRIRKFSDVLLIFLLKGARPQKYKDNIRMEHAGEITLSAALDQVAQRVTQRTQRLLDAEAASKADTHN
jgi:hypothetical protein